MSILAASVGESADRVQFDIVSGSFIRLGNNRRATFIQYKGRVWLLGSSMGRDLVWDATLENYAMF
jgi:hypothetical protein